MSRAYVRERAGLNTLPWYTCQRCGHVWHAKHPNYPASCPRGQCRSPYWDRPRPAPITCKRCAYRWRPTRADVFYCPNCRQPWAMARQARAR